MSKIDRLKEEIGWLKIVFGILIATDISLVAWMAKNYMGEINWLRILCAIAILLNSIAIIWINRVAYRKIDKLEEL